MKPRTKLFIFSAILMTTTLIIGCDQPQELTNALKTEGKATTEIKDSEVTVMVKNALLLDGKIKDLNIAVSTLKGDVKLIGLADSQTQIDYVDTLVCSVEGVHSIHGELSIKQ